MLVDSVFQGNTICTLCTAAHTLYIASMTFAMSHFYSSVESCRWNIWMDSPRPACTITVTELHQPTNSSHLTSAQCDEVICLIILDIAPSQLCVSLFVIIRVATSCHPTVLYCYGLSTQTITTSTCFAAWYRIQFRNRT